MNRATKVNLINQVDRMNRMNRMNRATKVNWMNRMNQDERVHPDHPRGKADTRTSSMMPRTVRNPTWRRTYAPTTWPVKLLKVCANRICMVS